MAVAASIPRRLLNRLAEPYVSAKADAHSGPLAVGPVESAHEAISGGLERLIAAAFDDLQDPADIPDRIERVLMDPRFHELRGEMIQLVTPDLMAEVSENSDPPADLRRLGLETKIRLVFRLIAAQGAALLQFFAHMALHPEATTELQSRVLERSTDADFPPEIATTPLRYVYSPDVPAIVSRGLMGAMESDVCLIALFSSEAVSRTPSVAAAVVDKLLDAQRAHLALVAALPGVTTIDSDLLPPGDRKTAGLIQTEQAAVEHRYEESLRAAQDSGLEVYPPLPADVRDE